jgi:hypothetical protein
MIQIQITKIFLPVLAILLVLSASNSIYACNLMDQSGVCEAAANADAIFVGTVYNVEILRPKEDETQRATLAVQIAHVRVEEVFKGKIEHEIEIRSGVASCGLFYRLPEQWLFYVSYDKENRTWSTAGMCGRSRQIEYAAGDLPYLRRLPDSAQQTRISGLIEFLKSDLEKGTTSTALSGVKVKIIGERRTAEAYTDSKGIYEIYGLPPGEYLIKTEVRPGMTGNLQAGNADDSEEESARVVLTEKSCAEGNFTFHLDAATSIAGKVLGPDGHPLPNALIGLHPKGTQSWLPRGGVGLQPKGRRALQSWQFVQTNNQGDYRLENIPPGEYLIVVNGNADISSYLPFARVYYPGVLKEEDAGIVTVTRGERLENYDISIPSYTTSYKIQGKLLYADRSPVVKGYVRFKADSVEEGTAGEAHTQTDAQGHFSLNILQGLDGVLLGFIYPDRDKFANCPALGNVAPGSFLETESLRLKITADQQDIELIVPCEKPEARNQ